MNTKIIFIKACILLLLFSSCGSKSNKRAVDAADLDKVMQEDAANAPAGPTRSTLSSDDLMQLSRCEDISCIQLFMKERSKDFFYTKKGEYTSLNRGMVMDSSGKEFVMPFSTVYFSSEPQATWRIAQTVHKKDLSDLLMNEFMQKGFVLVDSFRYYATEAQCYQFTSPQFPRTALFYSPTYKPWHLKGLYMKPSWLGYVFEVHYE